MAKYKVTITEYLRRHVYVEADSAATAEDQVKGDYYSGDIILYAEDMDDVDFKTVEITPLREREISDGE